MEIAIKCSCGHKYTVDEEPVNARLRFPVACPKCGADGTLRANEYIRKQADGELEKQTGGLFRCLRRNRGTQNHSASEGPSLPRLILAILVAGVITIGAMFLWHEIKTRFVMEFRFIGWGLGSVIAIVIGLVIGFSARFAAGSGGLGLAGVASLCAFISVIGGEYLVLRDRVDWALDLVTNLSYARMQDYAKQAVKATTDEEIILALQEQGFTVHDATQGENPILCRKRNAQFLGAAFNSLTTTGSLPNVRDTLRQIVTQEEMTIGDLALFRQKELPELKEFLKGKPSAEEFSRSLQSMLDEHLSLNKMVAQSWSPYLLLWLFLGAFTAHKIAYNRWETE